MYKTTRYRDDPDLKLADAIIKKCAPGLYRLRDLFDVLWVAIECPTDFGIRFKRAVRAGEISGIRLGSVTAQNHQVYVVGS